MDTSIVLPSQPKTVEEKEDVGIYEIDGLYPGYGHTFGNSLRRIILSSLPGSAIISVSIEGVSHEFATVEGVKEDVIEILLNLKKVRIRNHSSEPVVLSLEKKGSGEVTAKDIKAPSQIEILNPDLTIAHITNKSTTLAMEMQVERGIGYVAKEELKKDRIEIGNIALDAVFTPIRRVNYEVEKMRVGDRTDFNKLRIFIETDGTIGPREVLERAITIMIEQLKAIVGFQDEEEEIDEQEESGEEQTEVDAEFLKTRIESLGLSTRTENALIGANIRTAGGLVRKSADDILDVEGLGGKGLEEIEKVLKKNGVELKETSQ